MPTLAAQFKEIIQDKKKEINQEALELMTLQELENEKILFGESKKGMTYAEAFKDTNWVEFVLARFKKSGKSEHLMFIRYVKLRMAEMTKDKKEAALRPKESKSSNGYEATPNQPKEAPPVPFDVWEELQTGEAEAVMSTS